MRPGDIKPQTIGMSPVAMIAIDDDWAALRVKAA